MLAVMWAGGGVGGWRGATHIVDHNENVGGKDENESNER